MPALRCGCWPAFSQTSARTSTSRASVSWSRLRATELQAAKGARELAELALKEYQEGIVKKEQAAREGELELAQGELKHATLKIEQAKERNTKIQAASTGAAYDLSQEQRFKLGIEIAQGAVGSAESKVELAKSSLKDLREYRIASRTKELTSEIERARSDELAKTATWEREQTRLRKMQRALSEPPLLTDHQKRMLTILDAAIPIDEQLNKKLAECEKAETLASRSRRNSTPWLGASPPLSKRDEMKRSMPPWRH